MLLYLLRHAEAAPGQPDEARPLTPKGLESIEQLARFLDERPAFDPQILAHSPLLRARQTAHLLAKRLSLAKRLEEVEGLRPEDDPAHWLKLAAQSDHSICLVGHNPHLSELAGWLANPAGGTKTPCDLKKAGLQAWERIGRGSQAQWLLRWWLTPKLLERK